MYSIIEQYKYCTLFCFGTLSLSLIRCRAAGAPDGHGANDRFGAPGQNSRGHDGRRARRPASRRARVPGARPRVSGDVDHDRLVLPAQRRSREGPAVRAGGGRSAGAHGVRPARPAQT